MTFWNFLSGAWALRRFFVDGPGEVSLSVLGDECEAVSLVTWLVFVYWFGVFSCSFSFAVGFG